MNHDLKAFTVFGILIALAFSGCSPTISVEKEMRVSKKEYAQSLAEVGESAYRQGVRCQAIVGNSEKCVKGIHEAYMETLNNLENEED